MTDAREIEPGAVLAAVPDEPRWVDLRGLLLSGRCRVFRGGDPAVGFAAASADHPYVDVWKRPGEAALSAALAAASAGSEVLVADEDAEPVAAALPGWRREGIVMHRWPAAGPPPPVPPPAGAVLRLPPPAGDAAPPGPGGLHHLPVAVRDEIAGGLERGEPLAAAEADGRWVAFCSAPLRTETLWDVSVDTLAAYRRRGLACACFVALARALAADGLTPVWGAHAGNAPSLALAARLGFVAAGTLVSFQPPAGRR